MRVTLTVNGAVRSADVAGPESLLTVLREGLDLPGTKGACEQGECGSCSVFLDGTLVCSCLVLAADAEGTSVITVEGMAAEGGLHPVQAAMAEAGAVQCGFCTPGFVLAAAAAIQGGAAEGDDLAEALAGNICRCTGYGAIRRALEGLRP
ncbi:MAG: (2Fe-2S)-binding protein [Actinobacteria bacterium]|nr:MAG: (2Fe-2S)-binding protein [Actinomycetota bacterium]